MAGPPAGGAVRLGAPKAPSTAASPGAPASVAVPQSAVKKMSFLSALRPTKLADAQPTNHVLLVGNKGCKTVAAVAVDIEDGPSANGRYVLRKTPGLPRPEGSRSVIITFDNQTSQSLLNHYGAVIDGQNIEIYHLMDPVMDEAGNVLYPGWDGGSAESGVIVSAAFKELLMSLRESGNVGLCIIDHYGKYLEDVAKFYAYSKANMPLDKKLEPSQWTPRANLINDIDHLVRTCVMPGGWVIATGSRDKNEGMEVTTFSKDRDEFAKKEVVPSKWMTKVLHNWANVIQVYKSQLAKGGYIWEAEVEEGRHPVLPLGAKVDITGRHIGAFMDKDAVKFPQPEEPKTPPKVVGSPAKPAIAVKA